MFNRKPNGSAAIWKAIAAHDCNRLSALGSHGDFRRQLERQHHKRFLAVGFDNQQITGF